MFGPAGSGGWEWNFHTGSQPGGVALDQSGTKSTYRPPDTTIMIRFDFRTIGSGWETNGLGHSNRLTAFLTSTKVWHSERQLAWLQEVAAVAHRNEAICDIIMRDDCLDAQSLQYPVLLFREGYVFLAEDPDELRRHARSTFAETRMAKWQICDSNGNLSRVSRWEVLSRRGLRQLSDMLLGDVFAEPILISERNLTLREFVQLFEPMLLEYRMYGNAYGNDENRFRDDLKNVKSFPELFKFVESAV